MRPKATGRYETREDLEYWVWWRYLNTMSTQGDIARAVKVSEPTVRNILNDPETNRVEHVEGE